MMTNLFSTFDPMTPSLMSANWMALMLFMLIPCVPNFIQPMRLTMTWSNILSFLNKELNPLTYKYLHFNTYLMSLFIMIAIMNFAGLLPYVFTPTSHMALTFPIAITIWLTITMTAMANNIYNTLAHLVPMNTPIILMPLMVLIELTSNIIRPLTLAIRLAANMTAGHILVTLITSSMAMAPTMYAPLIFTTQVCLNSLEMAVALIQAYVFMILATLYLEESTH